MLWGSEGRLAGPRNRSPWPEKLLEKTVKTPPELWKLPTTEPCGPKQKFMPHPPVAEGAGR